MFSSLFSTHAPDAQNLEPVSSRYTESQLLGKLEPKDTEWLCSSGFATETQCYYVACDDGTSLMWQVIYSSVGPWFPQIQFTSRVYNPKKNVSIWKSVNVSNFVTAPPRLDKRSCKGDQFSITHKSEPDGSESYLVNANLDQDLQLSLTLTRPAEIPGYKIGNDAKAGYTYYGPDSSNPEGYMVHRFWPRFNAKGHIITKGQAQEVQGPGMFVHAIQGMRPNLIACRWNFADFQSTQHGGVSAIHMELTTTEAYGKKGAGSGNVVIAVGSLVVGGKLAAVTAETKWPGEEQVSSEEGKLVARSHHHDPVPDSETGYPMPSSLTFDWAGPSLLPDQPGTFRGKTRMDVGDLQSPKGLIAKVDVLGEIPKFVKTALSYVAGTKPYMYQWYNPVTLEVVDPEGKKIEVEGDIYVEATFVSEK